MIPTSLSNGGRRWKFFRAGGFDQVKLDSGADLAALDQLDQKLWAALACPAQGLEFDAKTLGLIDTDKDGRIRAPEMIAATKWAVSCLRNPDDLLKSSAALPLSSINDSTSEGQQLLASAKQVLANLGKKDAPTITVDDTADTTRIFAQTVFNGDGIVPADSAEDPDYSIHHQRDYRLCGRRNRPQWQTGREPGEARPVFRRCRCVRCLV